MKRRVLVTGASGFIGRQALPILVERGYEVHAVRSCDPDTASDQNRAPVGDDLPIIWHTADLLDHDHASNLVAGVEPSHLLHLAWFAKPGEFWTAPENLRWVEASVALLHAFSTAGGERAVFAGTCAEYSWGSDEPLDELTAPRHPATLYGKSKESLRQLTAATAETSGISTAWGEIFFLYGPHEYPERLVASVIRSLLSGEAAKTSHGKQVRDFLHVRDVASAFVALLDSVVTGPVNIGSGDAVTIADVVWMIGDSVGRPDLLEIGALEANPDEPAVIRPSVRRLHEGVGWRPSISLQDGINETVEWWRKAL